MSKKIIRGFRTNMTLYSLCLIAFVAVTVPFQPLLAAAEGYAPLPEEYRQKDFMTAATEVGVRGGREA